MITAGFSVDLIDYPLCVLYDCCNLLAEVHSGNKPKDYMTLDEYFKEG